MPALHGLITLLAAALALVFGLGAGAVLWASAAADLAGDRALPHHAQIYRVLAQMRPDIAAASTGGVTFRLLNPDLAETARQSGLAVLDATWIAAAPGASQIGDAAERVVLETLAVEARFPGFFEVRQAGRRLTGLPDDQGVWLTRSGALRLAVAGGVPPREVDIGPRRLPVLGVIEDPAPGDHIQYEALVLADHVFAMGRPARDDTAAVYVRARGALDDTERELAPSLSGSLAGRLGAAAPFFIPRLEPAAGARIRSASARFGDLQMIQTGQALEFYAAAVGAVAAMGGAALALGLLVTGWVARRRQALGVRVMLGAAPGEIALRLALAAAAVLAVAGGLVLAGAGQAAGPVMEALGKSGADALGADVLAGAALAGVLVLAAVLAALAPLWLTPPARLAFTPPGQSLRASLTLAAGLAVLAGGAASLAYAAMLFEGEMRAGARLAPDDDRVWVTPFLPEEAARRLRAHVMDRPEVEEAIIVNWSFFDTFALNWPMRLGDRDLVQLSVLTGDDVWPRFQGAALLAGEWPQQGHAPYCQAVIDEAAARRLYDGPLTDLPGRHLHYGFDDGAACLVRAVAAQSRRTKLSISEDPQVHLTGSARSTVQDRTGAPLGRVLVRLRPGVSPARARALMAEAMAFAGPAVREPPRTQAEIGARAYERERRMASLLAAAAGGLAAVFLVVAAALALQTLATRRQGLAVRLALGARPAGLAVKALFPVLLAGAAGLAAAAGVSAVSGPAWRSVGALAGAGPMAEAAAIAAAGLILLAPVLLVFALGAVMIARMSPAALLRG
ncbi:MAG: hypothetical protein GC187_08985 [Alphaproteobacteria bacterium]|nr:hypothetical protein [Alphaproteobacteria bacterium]